MPKVNLTIDGIPIKANEGEKVLWAALDNGIYIPNLCALRDMDPPSGACRLCLVQIEGRADPVTACTEVIQEGMEVDTKTPGVQRLRRTAFELLIADHPIECGSCSKNRLCQLQKIASFTKLKLKKPKRLRDFPAKSLPLDSSSPFFIFDPNKCVLCGKCVWVCHEWQGIGALNFSKRGYETRVSTFDNVPLIESGCDSCGWCVAVCPVGALVPKREKLEKC